MPEENADQIQTPPPAAPKAMGKLTLLIIVALASSGAGGATAWFITTRSLAAVAGPAEEPARELSPEEALAAALERGAPLPLDPFVVNLADADAARYLRVTMSLMLDDGLLLPEVRANLALQTKLRDAIIQTLTLKTSQDLLNAEGKDRLRDEIRSKLDSYFRGPRLVGVMFTEFVIQL